MLCILFCIQIQLAYAQCDEVIAEIKQKIDSTRADRDYERAVNLLLYAQEICPEAKKEMVRNLFQETFTLIQLEKERAEYQAKVSEYRRLLNLARQETDKKNQIDATALIIEAYRLGLPPDLELYNALLALFQQGVNGKIPVLKEVYSRNKDTPFTGITQDGNLMLIPSKDSTYEVIQINDSGIGNRLFNFKKETLPERDTTGQFWRNSLNAQISINKQKNRVLVTPGGNRAAVLYNRKGEQIFKFTGKEHGSYFATFSPDGNEVVALTINKKLKIYDINGKELRTIGGDEEIDQILFSPDYSLIAALIPNRSEQIIKNEYGQEEVFIDFQNKMKVWDLKGNLIQAFENGGSFPALNIVFSQMGKKIINYAPNALTIFDYDGKIIKCLTNFPENAYINRVQFSPQGDKFILQLTDNFLPYARRFFLYNIQGEKECDFPEHMELSQEVYFIPTENKMLIDHGYPGLLGLWHGNCDSLTTLKHNDPPSIVLISEKQKRIITFSGVEELKIWDFGGNLIDSFNTNLNLAFYPFEISPDEQLFMYATDDSYLFDMNGNLISKIDVSSPKFIENGTGMVEHISLNGDKGPEQQYNLWEFTSTPYFQANTSLRFDDRLRLTYQDDNLYAYIAKSGFEKKVKSWNVKGEKLNEVSFDQEDVIFMEKDCSHMVVWNNKQLKGELWDAKTNSSVDLGVGYTPMQVYLNTKHKRIVAHFYNYAVKIWDFDGNLLLQTDSLGKDVLHIAEGNNSIFLPNALILSKDTSQAIVRLWEKFYFANLKNDTYIELKDHEKWIMAADFSESGLFVTGGWDGKMIIWNEKGEKIDEIQAYNQRIEHIVINTNNAKILTASGTTIKIWDFANGRINANPEYAFSLKNEYIKRVSFISSSDIKCIKIVYQGAIDVVTLEGKVLRSIPIAGYYPHFSLNEEQLILDSNRENELVVYSSDYRLVKKLENQKKPVFSPNGKHFISEAGDSNDLILFDRNGAELAVLPHATELRGAKFSPSGNLILSLELNSAKLWNLEGELIGVLSGHNKRISGTSFIDEEKILSTSIDGEIIIWPTPPIALDWLKGILPFYHLRRTDAFLKKYNIQADFLSNSEG